MEKKVTKDFADFLSPMLVKEMRQGMRGRIFVSAFLLIQALMIFSVVMSLVDSDNSFDASGELFWVMIGLPLLLIMPARGFGTLGSELKENTLELIYLTRLSSWRIVVGKWSAIMAQTLLLACSVLPYVVLRYFLGGINLLDELEVLGIMFFFSALLTAMAVAVSPFQKSLLARLFFSFGPILMIFFGFAFIQNQVVFRGGGSSSPGMAFYMAGGLLGPLFLLLMFEVAVTRIAPPAENHSFRIRLLGLLILGALVLLRKYGIDVEPLRFIGILLLMPICIMALCESPKEIPSIYLPFVKRGLFGRLAGLLFYPGWASGILYFFLVYVLFTYIFFSASLFSNNSDQLLLHISFIGTITFPLAVVMACFARFNKTLPIYLGLQTFMVVVAVLASPLKDSHYAKWMQLAAPLPTSVFFLQLYERIDPHLSIFFPVITFLAMAFGLLILVAKMPGQWRRIRALEKEAQEDLLKQDLPLPPPDADPA